MSSKATKRFQKWTLRSEVKDLKRKFRQLQKLQATIYELGTIGVISNFNKKLEEIAKQYLEKLIELKSYTKE